LWNEAGALPSNSKVLYQILQNADDNTRALVAQLDTSVPIPNTPHMTVVWEALLKGFNRYGANIMNAGEAAELMQHLAERTIENQQTK
jgi:maltose-binding protein MalE